MRTTPSPSRRSVLRATAGLALTGSTALTLAAACGNNNRGPDELEAPLAAARADAALATVAGRAFPDLAARVHRPSPQTRRAHADALAAGIRRARPDRADAVAAPVTKPPPPASSAAAATALAGFAPGGPRLRVGPRGAHGALPQRARRLRGGRLRGAHGGAGVTGSGATGMMAGRFDDSDTRAAVEAALGAEHAAVWSYGLATAFLRVR